MPLHGLQQDCRSRSVRRPEDEHERGNTRMSNHLHEGPYHLGDRTEPHSPQPPGVSQNVPTSESIRITTPPEVGGMGHRMKRKEDPRFIQGKGNYVDDIKL